MQNLTLLPRPLVIWANITDKIVPCVQWHGMDSSGNITDEQFLFPIYGMKSQYIEYVRADFWRVHFLGRMTDWNELHPEHPYSLVKEGEMQSSNPSIIRMYANELYCGAGFLLECCTTFRSEQGVLLSPASYENPDFWRELPVCDVDREIQEAWRKLYRRSEWSGDLSSGLLNHFLSDEIQSQKINPAYMNWLEGEQEKYRYC